jgi:hypothetical protein
MLIHQVTKPTPEPVRHVRYDDQTHALASPEAQTNRTKKTKNAGP